MRGLHASTIGPVRAFFHGLPAPPAIRSIAELVYRTFRNFAHDNGPHMAAGLAYYSVFSLFPLAFATVAVLEYVVTSQDLQAEVITFLDRQLPGGGNPSFIRDNLETIAAARNAFGAIAFVGLIWAGRAVFGAIRRVVNRAWKVVEPPHFLTDQFVQVAASIGAVVLFLTAAIGGAIGRAIAVKTDLLPVDIPWELIFEVVPFFLNTTLYVLVYRLVPDTDVRWRDAIPAGILAGLALEATKLAFSYYLANIARLDLVYGSITTLVVFLIFFYIVSLILVIGAEFSSEIRRTDRAEMLNLRREIRPVPGGLASVVHRPRAHAADGAEPGAQS